jgi:hypothetical protein
MRRRSVGRTKEELSMLRFFSIDDWIAFRSRLHGLWRWVRLVGAPAAGTQGRGSQR